MTPKNKSTKEINNNAVVRRNSRNQTILVTRGQKVIKKLTNHAILITGDQNKSDHSCNRILRSKYAINSKTERLNQRQQRNQNAINAMTQTQLDTQEMV